MGNYRATTGLREIINEKRSVSLGVAILMLICAGVYAGYTMHGPRPRPKGDKAFYTVDDGKTWFVDSIYKVPPFIHDGKTAVRALVYSYDNGQKQFCPTVERYSPEMEKKMDDAVIQANRDGMPLSSISLFNSPGTLNEMEIKRAGTDDDWVSRGDRDSSWKVLSSIKAPDGSAVDLVIP